jgi:hypothetical protein
MGLNRCRSATRAQTVNGNKRLFHVKQPPHRKNDASQSKNVHSLTLGSQGKPCARNPNDVSVVLHRTQKGAVDQRHSCRGVDKKGTDNMKTLIGVLGSRVINRVSYIITGGGAAAYGVDPASVPVEVAVLTLVSALVNLLSEWAEKKTKG